MTRLEIQVSLLHTNLQGLNFRRCKCAGSSKNQNLCHEHHTWVTLQGGSLSPISDDPSALSSPTYSLSPVSNSSCLFTSCQSLYASLYRTMIFFKVRKCKIILYCVRLYCKIKMFHFFVCFLCIICVKSIISLLQYSTT